MRYVQGEVRRICRAAGLPDAITFTKLRMAATQTAAMPD